MKIIKNFTLFKESRGLSNAVKGWTEFIYSIIEEEIRSVTIDDCDLIENLYYQTGITLLNTNINRRVAPFVNELWYKELPLKDFEVDIVMNFVNDINNEYYKPSGHFIDSNTYVDVDKNYCNGELKFVMFLSDNIIKTDNKVILNKHEIESNIAHELTHVYEFYQKRLKDKREWKSRSLAAIKNIINKLDVPPKWEYFLEMLYLSIDSEINARVAQANYEIGEYNSYEEFLEKLKNTRAYEALDFLEKFNPVKFYETLDLSEEELEYLITQFNTVIDYINTDIFQSYKLGSINKKGIYFINYWAKIFTFKASKFRKKLLKLYKPQ